MWNNTEFLCFDLHVIGMWKKRNNFGTSLFKLQYQQKIKTIRFGMYFHIWSLESDDKIKETLPK